MQFKVFGLIIPLLLALLGYSQSGFLPYSIKNGLTQNAVTTIFRDSKGLVWMGTQDGLNRFGGLSFKQYKHNPTDSSSLSDQYITAISEDGSGTIWVGTRNGLNKLDLNKGKFERIHPDPSKKKVIQYVFDQIYPIGNGNLAIVVEGQLFIWEHRSKYFKKLTRNVDNQACYTANAKGIWKYSKGQFYLYHPSTGKLLEIFDTHQNNQQPFVATALYHDQNQAIWVVNETNESKPSIQVFDTKKFRWLKDSIVLNEKINQISFDQKNIAWVSSLSGIIKIDSTFKPFFWKSNQLPLSLNQSNAVLCTYHDTFGLSWIGFANNGALLYNPASSSFQLFQPENKRETVFAYAQDSLGNDWVASISGLYKKTAFTQQTKLIVRKKVRALAVGENGSIWAAIENEGLYKIDPSSAPELVASVQNKKLVDNTIFHLNFNQKTNQLFIATKSGLIILNLKNNQIVRYYAEATLVNNQITGSYVLHSFTDSKGRTWVSTNAGIDVFDQNGNRIIHYKTDSNQSPYIKRTIITGCTEDKRGNIWIATLSNGIYKWDNGKFTSYNQSNGLSGNIVSGIMADSYNRIWVATTSGMNLLNQQSGRIDAITEQNGVPASDYLLASIAKNNKGHILLGSSEGLVMINPSSVWPIPIQLKCFVTDAAINYSPVSITKHFQLDADDKSISLEISAPCFINADKVVYQYRCLGLVDQWVTLQSNNRRISFTNFPYKKLLLEFRAAENIALFESASVGSIFISRKPPIWQNSFFIIPIFILLLLGIVFFIRFLTKRKVQQQLQKAAVEQGIYKERERISRDLHDHLGAYAAAIKSNIIQLEKMDSNSSETMYQLKGNAEDMVSALRETIWVMQYQQISMTSLSDRFKNLINRIAPNYPSIQIDVKEEIIQEKMMSPGVSIHLLRMMQEALTNSLKHAQCTQIFIKIAINDPILVVIEDNGIGFDMKKGSDGYGLQNMQDRASEAGLDAKIISELGKGTRISFRF